VVKKNKRKGQKQTTHTTVKNKRKRQKETTHTAVSSKFSRNARVRERERERERDSSSKGDDKPNLLIRKGAKGPIFQATNKPCFVPLAV